MESFDLTVKIRNEMNAKTNRLNELAKNRRSSALEKQQAKEHYTQLVADGAGQHEIDTAYNVYQEKTAIHDRYTEEYEIMSNSDGKFSVTGEQFADKYDNEYAPKVREKHLYPIIDKLEKLKDEYLEHLGQLGEVLEKMEVEQQQAENIMKKRAFRKGENNNILINITNIGHISNEMIDRAIITDNQVNNYISRYLL